MAAPFPCPLQIDLSSCNQCPANAESPAVSSGVHACVCKAGYYLAGASIAADDACVVCPTGTTCAATNVTTQTLPLNVGQFRISTASADIRRCPDYSGNSSCVGGAGADVCRAWTAGPYCQQVHTCRFGAPSLDYSRAAHSSVF